MIEKEIMFKPQGVCSKYIKINLKEADDKGKSIVSKIIFMGGCPGNSLALSQVLEGKTVEEVIGAVQGVKCGSRETSCPDQLTKALKNYLEE